MRNKGSWKVFPELLDATISRREGRRTPVERSVETPSLVEVKLAAQLLGYDVEVHKDKAYPRRWYDCRGLATISIVDDLTKHNLLLQLSDTIRDRVRPALQKKKEQQRTKKDREKGVETRGKLIRQAGERKPRRKKIVRRR